MSMPISYTSQCITIPQILKYVSINPLRGRYWYSVSFHPLICVSVAVMHRTTDLIHQSKPTTVQVFCDMLGVIWTPTVFIQSNRKEALSLEKGEQLTSIYGNLLACKDIHIDYMKTDESQNNNIWIQILNKPKYKGLVHFIIERMVRCWVWIQFWI